jgi:hypothetical protein
MGTNVLIFPFRVPLGAQECDDGHSMRGEARDNFRSWLRSWGASDSTVTVRLRVCAAFERDHDPETASVEDIAAWLARPGLSPWTRHSYYGHLRPDELWQALRAHADERGETVTDVVLRALRRYLREHER